MLNVRARTAAFWRWMGEKKSRKKGGASSGRPRRSQNNGGADVEDETQVGPFGLRFAAPVWDWLLERDKTSFLRNTALVVIVFVVAQEMLAEQNAPPPSVASTVDSKYEFSAVDDHSQSLFDTSNERTSARSQSYSGGSGVDTTPDYLKQLRGSSGSKKATSEDLDDDTDNAEILERGRKITGTLVFPDNEAGDKTTVMAQILAGIIVTYNISSVADITCRWTSMWTAPLHFQLLTHNPDFKYYCVDNNPVALHGLLPNFPKFRNVYFLRRHIWDPMFLKIPEAQLYLSVDGFQRQTIERLEKSFENMKLNARPEFLLMTINPNRRNPNRGSVYKYSRLDFHSEPFNFPTAIRRFSDLTNDPTHMSNPKQLSLWRLDDINFPPDLPTPTPNADANPEAPPKPEADDAATSSSDQAESGSSTVIGGAATIGAPSDSGTLQGSTEGQSRRVGDANGPASQSGSAGGDMKSGEEKPVEEKSGDEKPAEGDVPAVQRSAETEAQIPPPAPPPPPAPGAEDTSNAAAAA